LREQTSVPSATGATDKRVLTYVIGFGIPQGDERIERIAIGGGTDNPSDGSGGLRAFYADDEAGLALAFAQIIADAQPPAEECNNEDDDCDGEVDEGLPKFCNKPIGIDDPLGLVASLNEWSEGHYLEPDERFGTGWLEAVAATARRSSL